MGDGVGGRSTPHLLVDLGQFAGHHDATITAESDVEILERSLQSVGRFVQHRRASFANQIGDGASPFLATAGQEPVEGETLGGQAADDERHHERGRTGNRGDDVGGFRHGAHDPFARVADARRAGVGHQTHVASLVQGIENAGDRGVFGVFVDAHEGGLDAEVLQHHPGATGVLTAHQSGPRQLFDRPGRDVGHVPDGRGDEDESAHEVAPS